MIHELADVKSRAIGENTCIWQFSVVLGGAIIGRNCNINCHTFIENDVIIGDSVTIKSGVFLWDGLRIGDYVFIGPNVTFINDNSPRSKQYPTAFQNTILCDHASIGANSTILGGITINQYAMVGAGSLVTKDVPARALVVGSPAKVVGWLNEDGSKMINEGGCFLDQRGNKWVEANNELILKDEYTLS